MIDFPIERLQPRPEAVCAALGLKDGALPSARANALLERALELFRDCSEPRGVSEPVTRDEFSAIYYGQGHNAASTPLATIFPRASSLHLFAFTLGASISDEIRHRFAGTDFALGSVLDAVASLAADQAGRIAEEWAVRQVAGASGGPAMKARLYSPGYCGWHISGQEELFARLRPSRIGIRLNSSFLMDPLKSISGVLLAGPAAIHQFSESYPFCAQCKSPTCREQGVARSA